MKLEQFSGVVFVQPVPGTPLHGVGYLSPAPFLRTIETPPIARRTAAAHHVVPSRDRLLCEGVLCVRIAAEPVVEVDQHGRAFSHGAKQVSEIPEHVWAKDIAFVLDQVGVYLQTLACRDVEVVEPEIDEHFLKLPFARDRSDQFLFGELDHRLPALSHLRRQVLTGTARRFVGCRVGHRRPAPIAQGREGREVIPLDKVGGVELEGIEVGELSLQCSVIESQPAAAALQ